MDFELALVRSGVIDPGHYVEAVTRQQEERLPLGQVALETGAMTARQVREVLQAQSDSSLKRFGEVAMSKGILKRRDLAELLMAQNERQLPLIEHLIELGAITEEHAKIAIAAYKAGARTMDGATFHPPTSPQQQALPQPKQAEPPINARSLGGWRPPTSQDSDVAEKELAALV